MTQIFSLRNFPASHLEVAKGPRNKARDYCMKPETRVSGPYEYPNAEAFTGSYSQGKRTDLDDVAEMVQSGSTMAQIAAEHPVSIIKFSKGIYNLLALSFKPREEPPDVILHYGPTGCNKTRSALQYADGSDTWINPIGKGGWFDGYSGQSVAVFDDFAGSMSHTQLTDLLRILDRYALQVPVKGSFVWFSPTRIVVTTNIHPSKWYDYSSRTEHYRALQRRFSLVLHWTASGAEPRRYTQQTEVDWQRFWTGPAEAQRRELGPMDDYVAWIPGDDPYTFM